ncbi:hypothetical protein LZ198_20095 [Myxococcus sp. K15C18031901]|uniref:hypothetical protein n=1 Tax=Myxococcus dinghuensis TaxID=2906761 RepID=UPI0020A75ABC|nr:hypothetical protein [Myxococcus dinghuensis]MCP3101182.1 hypothetical protein [Myxococcus dinghuensis]
MLTLNLGTPCGSEFAAGAPRAFTFAGLDRPEAGLQYHPAAARRSWAAMRTLVEEVFARA